MLFDESTLRKLNRLTLVASQVRAGLLKGDRRSTKRGSSQEFADYRDYSPGDDLRRVDWKAYARLDRPFLKLFEEEQDLAVHILIDGSGSMDWGTGEAQKFSYALHLAAALGAIALNTGDVLTAALLPSIPATNESRPRIPPAPFGPTRGTAASLHLLRYLEKLAPGGSTDLNRALRDYALASRRPGLAVLISDLLVPEGHQAGLAQLQGRGYELVILHLLSPDELEPPLTGDLKLVDIESGASREVSIDSDLRRRYRQRLQDWQAELRQASRQRAVRYVSVNTAQPWEKVVLQELRQAGVVQ